MIRFLIGLVCIFGAVGAIETADRIQDIAPVLWLAVGIAFVFSVINTGVR